MIPCYCSNELFGWSLDRCPRRLPCKDGNWISKMNMDDHRHQWKPGHWRGGLARAWWAAMTVQDEKFKCNDGTRLVGRSRRQLQLLVGSKSRGNSITEILADTLVISFQLQLGQTWCTQWTPEDSQRWIWTTIDINESSNIWRGGPARAWWAAMSSKPRLGEATGWEFKATMKSNFYINSQLL